MFCAKHIRTAVVKRLGKTHSPTCIPLIEFLNSTISFQMKELWEVGTVNAKTRCWSQGMDGWRPLLTVPQLKWSLLATGQAVNNETDLAILVLNMLIKICEYYPSR